MLNLFIFFCLLGASAAEEAACYENGVDYIGANINNGMELHTDSAAECQVNCQMTHGCHYFTWADASFSDPSLRSTCWLRSDLTGRRNHPHVISGPRMCTPDEPTTTSPAGDCREYVFVGGPNFEFFYSMGYMKKQHGKSSYKQIQGQHILQYKAEQGWVVTVSEEGDVLAYTKDPARCAYEATSTWWYLDHGEWFADPDLRARVSPEEQCNQDVDCAGCGFIHGWNGHDWCCSNDCDWGWIDLLANGGCNCGH